MPDGKIYGHICGRFQPFHRKHLKYARLAAEHDEVDVLIVGITNADPSHIEREEKDTKRHKQKHNPFRYHERLRMIERTLENSDISTPFQVMPFPLNRPELWEHYAPEDAIHFIGIVEDWHEEKAERIERNGRKVERLPMDRQLETEKVSGTKIRERIAKEGKWEHLVPDAVADFIEQENLEERIKEIYKD